MLDPDARSLYTHAVVPPPGYVFDCALATTYTLDPASLLSLPTHLALGDRRGTDAADPLRLLESLRRIAGRFTVYVDHMGMRPPTRSNVLYSLLESMVIPVRAPRGGVFHPKLWILRYMQPGLEDSPVLRLLVLSRNITYDRSWDISVQLEGRPGGRNIAANRPLAEFVTSLNSLAVVKVPSERRRQAERLAEEIRKTAWECPGGFEEVCFHVLGTGGKAWSLPKNSRMAVISPFITEDAVKWLSASTEKFAAVVSRPEELHLLPEETRALSQAWHTLNEAAETEEGEEPDRYDMLGLHAKAYVTEKGWWTRLYLGSPNATGAALLQNTNVEALVELRGRTSRVGGIDALLGETGLGPFLTPYCRPDIAPVPDSAELRAGKALEEAKKLLARGGLKVVCKPKKNDWLLTLEALRSVPLPGIARIRIWPITVPENRAVLAPDVIQVGGIGLGQFAVESITGLIAFELRAKEKPLAVRMVLNLPVKGLPSDRDDAVFRRIVNNRENFLRYILLLLGEYEDNLFAAGLRDGHTADVSWKGAPQGDIPLLEELVRAFSRSPEKMADVRSVVRRLTGHKSAGGIIPREFMVLWEVFEQALSELNP